MEIKKASRAKTKIKMGISGPSGSGKTYSAILIAKGLCDDLSKVCVIDTEKSADLYENLGEYNVLSMKPPFTIESFKKAMTMCEKAGMQVIIIDSLSHFWIGEGGLLDKNDTLAKTKYKGNSYMAWSETTPEYRDIIDAIRYIDAHVICCLRVKTDYAIEKLESGKVSPKKVGLKEEMRDGFDYELSIMFNIDYAHSAAVSKDRTGLFDMRIITPSVETGEEIRNWCESPAGNYETLTSQEYQEIEMILDKIRESHPKEHSRAVNDYRKFTRERYEKFIKWYNKLGI
jgi:hypothetical protein